jgi:peptidoglycan hydrolase CwlO-like protein
MVLTIIFNQLLCNLIDIAQLFSYTFIFFSQQFFPMTEAVITSVLEEALRQASERIARKLTEGKRLTDTEVIILLLDQMNKRMEIMNESLNKRIDDTNKRIDDLRDDVKLLRQEVSSIKSDIINLLKERLTGT